MNITRNLPLPELTIIGPCSLESWEQMVPLIAVAKKLSTKYLRAPLYKPRTSPKSFQGIGEAGLPIIQKLEEAGQKLVTEALSLEQLSVVGKFASIIQIGARNMQNFELLKQIGQLYSSFKYSPQIMLKRGFSNNYNEWILSAEYLTDYGVPPEKIILCERGTRNAQSPFGVTLDFNMALKAKCETTFKVIIDPSHGSNHAQLVLPMANASLALGFDGLMLEVHPNPIQSKSDAHQALHIEDVLKWHQG